MDIYVVSCLRLARRPLGLNGKTFNAERHKTNFSAIYFIPATLVGIIVCCHLMPLSLTFILVEGHKVRANHIIFDSVSDTFQLNRMEFNMVLEQFKLNILILLFDQLMKEGN